MCGCTCVWVCVCEDEGVYMFWSPSSIITIIFPFTSAPVIDDNVWELHTWESDVFIWRAAWDWVLKSVRVHGMHTHPSSRKQHRNTGADKREEGPDSKRVSKNHWPSCPHTIAERIRRNCTLKLWLLHAHTWTKRFKSTAIPKENSECPDKFYSRKWKCQTMP